MNVYLYVLNDPINKIDPDGRFVLSLGFLAVDLWTLGKNIAHGNATFADGAWVAFDVVTLAADFFTVGTVGEGLQAGGLVLRAAKVAKYLSIADAANVAAHLVNFQKGDGGSKSWLDYMDEDSDCPKFEKMKQGDNTHFNDMFKAVMDELYPGITTASKLAESA